MGLAMSPSLKVIAAALLSAFFVATASAPALMSVAVTIASGHSFLKVIAIAPLPVPMSATLISLLRKSFRHLSIAPWISSSVSGRGINTLSST